MKAGKESSAEQIKTLFDGALGKACWHVSIGAPTSPEFSLALGEKIKREKPLENLQQPKVFRHNEGEVSIFVRCVWRLEQGSLVIVSSDDTATDIKRGLSRILGRKLVGLKTEKPAWDLSLEFANGLRLKIFCERTERRSRSRRNWQARIGIAKIYAGPGAQMQISK
jgi:hypothetical protein